MDFFPVFARLSDRHVLVVGGGGVALRKVRLLLKSPAAITVVAPELSDELAAVVEGGRVRHVAARFSPDHLKGADLVFAATAEAETNQLVSELCHAQQIPVNVVDNPQLSSFITPAIVDRDPLVIAISSAGAAPVLVRRIREQIEALLPSRYGQLAALTRRYRERVKQALPEAPSRLRFWERVFDGSAAERALTGDEQSAEAEIEAVLERASDAYAARQPDISPGQGEVYLVGAGPGEPDLLTFRAMQLMQRADVVLHDRLVSDDILELVRRDADRVYVGKRRDRHTLPQDEINRLLVDFARAGKRVLRLKGGDPFLFGRGGEEIELLMAQGIPFQVVPGITAATGCAAYAGIPLTHRDYAQSCCFVTGHPRDDGQLSLPWASLALPNQTVVVYMGRQTLATICAELVSHGRDGQTPVAVITHGTLPAQQVITGTLADIADRTGQSLIDGPSIVIIGEVVALRDQLAWFRNGSNTSA